VILIGSVTAPVTRVQPAHSLGSFTYVDLSSVDSTLKEIVAPKLLSANSAPSRARQLLRTHDVLVSTVRPNLNGVAVVPEALDGAIGSTGFSVLRSDPDAVEHRYLFHWVRSIPFISEMERRSSGASYPAVSDSIVRGSSLPLPPLAEQRAVARVLDLIDKLRSERRRAIQTLDHLADSLFFESFGDLVANEMGWPVRNVGEYVKGFQSGKSLVGSDNRSEARVLKISAVTSGDFDPNESKPLPLGYVPPPEHLVGAGDVLFSRANTTDLVGATAYVYASIPGLALPDKLWRFVWTSPQETEPQFMWKAFARPEIRRLIADRANGSGGSMKNVTQRAVLDLRFALPPHRDQKRFASRFSRVTRVKSAQQAQLELLDEMYRSKMDEFFPIAS